MLDLHFVALWFILRGDLLYVFPCVILFLCFSVLLVLRLPRLGKRELILVLFVRLFGLSLFGFVGFLFLLGSGKGCGFMIVALPELFSYFFSKNTSRLEFMQQTCVHIRSKALLISQNTTRTSFPVSNALQTVPFKTAFSITFAGVHETETRR